LASILFNPAILSGVVFLGVLGVIPVARFRAMRAADAIMSDPVIGTNRGPDP
jgi:uncharacterized MnhB-related membrane protein